MLESLKYVFDSNCFDTISKSNLKENEKNQRNSDRIKKEHDMELEYSSKTSSDITFSTASPAVKEKNTSNNGMFGTLSILGIVATGAGVYVFSEEIQEKIEEIREDLQSYRKELRKELK